MITAIVNFQLPADTDPAQAKALFEASVPRFQGAAGLVRKYYLYDPETKISGGVYLWETRAAAEAMYSGVWRTSIVERFGNEPTIRYFETPVIVDNTLDAQAAE